MHAIRGHYINKSIRFVPVHSRNILFIVFGKHYWRQPVLTLASANDIAFTLQHASIWTTSCRPYTFHKIKPFVHRCDPEPVSPEGYTKTHATEPSETLKGIHSSPLASNVAHVKQIAYHCA